MQIKFIQKIIDKVRGKNNYITLLNNIQSNKIVLQDLIYKLEENNNKKIEDIYNQLNECKTLMQNNYNEISNWRIEQTNEKILNKLRKKVKNGEKIKVAFIVIWASQFTSSKIYELMKNDPIFEPVIIVNKIPHMSEQDDIRFGDVFENSVKELKEKYGTVLTNFENGKYIDYSDEIDIAILNVTYPPYFHSYMKIPYLISKNILSILIPYGFYISKTSSDELISQDIRYEYVKYLYKFYVDNEYLYSKLIEKSYNNAFYGYPKIDNYHNYHKNSDKISIILAPHQDLTGSCFCGNFLNTYKIYQEIPKMFPDIEFIFRPHPLWYSNLSFEWGKEKTDDYLNSVISQPNVKYSTEADYYQAFANSSAMIHDCGSFLPEYMITNKPSMYLQDNKEIYSKYYNDLGLQCLDNMYIGSQIEDVKNFIQDVVINGNDYMKEQRINFVKANLSGYYPNTSEKIFEDIKNEITRVTHD